MQPHIPLLIAVLHGLAGAALVAGIYTAVEYRLQSGVLFAAAFAVGVLAVDFTVGPILFDLTYPELKAAIWSAVLGTVAGAAIVVTLYEPELDNSSKDLDINDIEL
jgi:succinate dehydrogenase/fumarate reductase cytochrome b subunit